MKRIIAVLLSLCCCLSCCVFSSAKELTELSGPVTGSFTIINYNVHGLTSFLGTDCIANSPYMGRCLSDFDIACVQEDFNYHTLLNSGLDFKYSTHHSGFSGVGDGLNIYSDYKIYNQDRVAWDQLSGVLDGGNDALTPKGFVYTVIEIADGVYVDLYDMHADAYDDEGSRAARKNNYEQLAAYIREHSIKDGRAYMVTGDFNYPLFYYTDLYTSFQQVLGCKDAFSEICNNGNVPDESVPYEWGRSNSVERLFYDDGDNVQLKVTTHDYVDFTNPDNGEVCSDHSAMVCTVEFTATATEDDFKVEHYNYIGEYFRRFLQFFRSLNLLISAAIKLI